jgi:phage shock protein A
VKQSFTESGLLEVAIRQTEVEDTLLKLKAYIQQVSLEEAALIKEIGGLELKFSHVR